MAPTPQGRGGHHPANLGASLQAEARGGKAGVPFVLSRGGRMEPGLGTWMDGLWPRNFAGSAAPDRLPLQGGGACGGHPRGTVIPGGLWTSWAPQQTRV